MENVILSALPSLLTAVVLYYWQRKQTKRDRKNEARAEARRQEALLGLKLQMATLKLTQATALALKNGKTNGEMEEGLAACNTAKEQWVDFMNTQAKEHLLTK